MNKYLVKIASSPKPGTDEYGERKWNRGRALSDTFAVGTVGGIAAGNAGAHIGCKFPAVGRKLGGTLGALAGVGLGVATGISTYKKLNARTDEDFDHPLTKKAFEFKNQHAKDLVDTGVIAGLGGVGNMLSAKLLKQHNAFSPKTFAVGTGVGLIADYAGIKINKALGHTKKDKNVPL
jgi:hypothetical protein